MISYSFYNYFIAGPSHASFSGVFSTSAGDDDSRAVDMPELEELHELNRAQQEISMDGETDEEDLDTLSIDES